MHTITIAGTEKTARSISNYFMLRESPRGYTWNGDIRRHHEARYETISAASALQYLEGRKPEGLRIVIGCDYMLWYTGAPGNLTDLFDVIQRLRTLGAMVVFR